LGARVPKPDARRELVEGILAKPLDPMEVRRALASRKARRRARDGANAPMP
jgi:hypothetical protein